MHIFYYPSLLPSDKYISTPLIISPIKAQTEGYENNKIYFYLRIDEKREDRFNYDQVYIPVTV